MSWRLAVEVITYGHAVLHQDVGVHDGDQLVEQVGLGVEQLRGQFLHHGLQLLGCRGRNPVPGLGFAPAEPGTHQH